MILTGDSVRTRLRRDRHAALSLSLSSPVHLPAAAQRAPAVSGTSEPMIEGPPELQHIVGGTDQRPFPAHLLHPAQQELPEAAALLDLAEHRLDDRFAPGIEPSTALRAERTAHPVGHRQSDRGPAPGRGRQGLTMVRPIGRNQGLTA